MTVARRRIAARAALCAAALALAGCATTGAPPGASVQRDPWENWNRKVFAFNEALDEAVIKPVATGYHNVVPELARTGVSNFFNNFADGWSAINSFLQLKIENGLNDTMRFAFNTLFGLGGLLDIAGEAGLEHHYEDFGQTLGRWGVPSGPYIVWPVLGPSAVRETLAFPLDRFAMPAAWASEDGAQVGLSVLQVVNARAQLLGATRLLDEIALDKYTFVRDAYLQRRRSLIYDGEPPEAPDEAEPPEAPASAPSAAASAPAR